MFSRPEAERRVAVIRTQARYARIGIAKFNDEARRMGRQPVLEVKFERGDKDLLASTPDDAATPRYEGLIVWGEAAEAGLILKQMRDMGMNQPVFGGSRLRLRRTSCEIAGPAAEGLVVTTALDPTRQDPKWLAFCDAYRQKFNEEPTTTPPTPMTA